MFGPSYLIKHGFTDLNALLRAVALMPLLPAPKFGRGWGLG